MQILYEFSAYNRKKGVGGLVPNPPSFPLHKSFGNALVAFSSEFCPLSPRKDFEVKNFFSFGLRLPLPLQPSFDWQVIAMLITFLLYSSNSVPMLCSLGLIS